jgi:hypothetical protein
MHLSDARRELRRKGARAWVVRWEWQGDRAAVGQVVVAIIRPQVSSRTVKEIVARLYAARAYQPDEMLHMVRRNGHDPYPARWGAINGIPWEGEIYCGHNPLLRARKATVRPKGDGSGGVEWEDDPIPEPRV